MEDRFHNYFTDSLRNFKSTLMSLSDFKRNTIDFETSSSIKRYVLDPLFFLNGIYTNNKYEETCCNKNICSQTHSLVSG